VTGGNRTPSAQVGETVTDQVQQRSVAGRYALLEEIGRGGMGVVWLAEDRTIGRRVAIKELYLPDGVRDEERTVLEERVLREARAAGRLNDPAVVTVYDVVQEAGGTFIVMELIEAPTLSDVVARQGPLPQEFVARLAEQLLSALETAHAAGIVHRDVKPSNIMVLPNGRVKLTDFGIAQSTDDPRLTTSGILVGSPSFMAPERIKGAQADAASDLWGLGTVLFFAVEGNSPFERSSTAATMHAIVSEIPFLTRCQGPLASAIMGLLNTVPQARLSAEQVRGLLAQATHTPPGGLTSQATSMYVPPTVRVERPKANRGLVIGLAAVLAAGMFTGGFFTSRAFTTGQEGGRPENLDTTLTYGDGGTIVELSWSTYPEGACMNGRLVQDQRLTEAAQVECDAPHDLQFYEARTYFDEPEQTDTFPDVSYPGLADMTVHAERMCTITFNSERVAGDENDKRELRFRALVPTEQAWDDGGRDLTCVLYRADGRQLTASQLASR
jgi:eukaryotic-like serine/threonine-protein kinase